MNPKGLSEHMPLLIRLAVLFLIALILATILLTNTKAAGKATNTDPSTGFNISKEYDCERACANEPANCSGVMYKDTTTCKQHQESIQKTLEVTFTPNELKTGAETLTVTVKDFKTKALLGGAKITSTYVSPSEYTTNSVGVVSIIYTLANIPPTDGVGRVDLTVKLANYSDASFSVLVRS